MAASRSRRHQKRQETPPLTEESDTEDEVRDIVKAVRGGIAGRGRGSLGNSRKTSQGTAAGRRNQQKAVSRGSSPVQSEDQGGSAQRGRNPGRGRDTPSSQNRATSTQRVREPRVRDTRGRDSSSKREDGRRGNGNGEKTFATFTRTFNGTETPEELEGFLEALTSFMWQKGMTEEQARRQVSQVLTGRALTWWITCGKDSESWDETVQALRETFGTVLQDHMLFDLMAQRKQQVGEKVLIYVTEMLVLNNRRWRKLPESVIKEMVYLGLKPELRRRIRAEEVETVNELRAKAAGIEAENEYLYESKKRSQAENQKEKPRTVVTGGVTKKPFTPRCFGCGTPGWRINDCRREGPCARGSRPPQGTSYSGGSAARWRGEQNRQDRWNGDEPRRRGEQSQTDPAGTRSTGRQAYEIEDIPEDEWEEKVYIRPMCRITIAGEPFVAVVDTGADVCAGGKRTYEICLQHNIPLSATEAPRMADGRRSVQKMYKAVMEIVCQGRPVNVEVLVQPERTEGQFLMGFNCLRKLGMVVDASDSSWHFKDQTEVRTSLDLSTKPKPRERGNAVPGI